MLATLIELAATLTENLIGMIFDLLGSSAFVSGLFATLYATLEALILFTLNFVCDYLLPKYDNCPTFGLILYGYRLRLKHKPRLNVFARLLHEGRLEGATILVTGSARGLGAGVAAQLAASKAKLVLPVRTGSVNSKALAANATAAMRASATEPTLIQPISPESLDVLSPECGLELGSLTSIERFVESLKQANVVLDAVVNNAGMVPIKAGTTEEGFEPAFGINYLGTAHLTQLLQSNGVLKAEGVVVNVSSEEHRLGSYGPHAASIMEEQKQQQYQSAAGDTDAPPLPKPTSPSQPFGFVPPHSMAAAMERYAYSKLLLTTYSYELNRRSSATVRDVCPGPVGSEIARDAPWPINKLTEYWMRWSFIAPSDAALPVVELAVQKCAKGLPTLPALVYPGEVHFHMSEAQDAGACADNPIVGEWLWGETQRLLQARKPPP